ncbi:MAG TPA: thiamine pyrophosphate-dependent enzyme [Terracidiphilus sp.]|nr:thiamine pyrophosphate-dependent enzyme [Terracidiphilus sp.]
MKVIRQASRASAQSAIRSREGGFSLISRAKLIQLYSAMIKSRMIAERAAALKQQGKLTGDLQNGLGREGTVAGVTVDLHREDTLSPSRCDFVSSVIKGMTLEQMFSRLGGSADYQAHGTGALIFDDQSNVIAPASELDSRLEVVRGAALVHKMAKNGRVVVVTCANGSAAKECWRDAVQFAEVHELPMLFVWHNDAEYPHDPPNTVERRARRSAAKPRCTPAITVDASDAVAVYRVASESIQRARLGRGPTLIECRKLAPANGSGLSTTTAAPSGPHDPIEKMEVYLSQKGLFHRDLRQKIADSFLPELNTATGILTP